MLKLFIAIFENAAYLFSGTEIRDMKAISAYFEKTWSTIKDEEYSSTEIEWLRADENAMVCLYQYNYKGYADGKLFM